VSNVKVDAVWPETKESWKAILLLRGNRGSPGLSSRTLDRQGWGASLSTMHAGNRHAIIGIELAGTKAKAKILL
jgi:hypothetical protein